MDQWKHHLGISRGMKEKAGQKPARYGGLQCEFSTLEKAETGDPIQLATLG